VNRTRQSPGDNSRAPSQTIAAVDARIADTADVAVNTNVGQHVLDRVAIDTDPAGMFAVYAWRAGEPA
jgi:hypothetical protein